MCFDMIYTVKGLPSATATLLPTHAPIISPPISPGSQAAATQSIDDSRYVIFSSICGKAQNVHALLLLAPHLYMLSYHALQQNFRARLLVGL